VRVLDEVEAHARRADVAVKGVHRSHRDPSRAILDVAEHAGHPAFAMARHDLLSPVYNWFTEGFDLPDLRDARTLLT
jgi:hypothetical protein